MAEAPKIALRYTGGCPDCGVREAQLPPALPDPGDDFDWSVRDYDGFRMFMLEELAARFPERTRWTPPDLEVVLVEAFAAILDQLSDMLDRVAAEAFLETARRPETVRRMAEFIGYDAIAKAKAWDQIGSEYQGEDAWQALYVFWRANPHEMERAKRLAPRAMHIQKRMVTTADYADRLRDHPLVADAHAWNEWRGSWNRIYVTLILDDEVGAAGGGDGRTVGLDSGIRQTAHHRELVERIVNFHEEKGIRIPVFSESEATSPRTILRLYVDAYRMVGQEVILRDPSYVGIYISITAKVGENHFQSEIRQAIEHALGSGPDGFFAPGRHGFGEDLYLSDLVETLMRLDGVEHVCINSFKRIGSQYNDRTNTGFIPLDGIEVALCDNDPNNLAYGYYRLVLQGGQKG